MAKDIDVSEYFKRLLQLFDCTQAELARYLGISQQSVATYVGGSRKLSAKKKEEYDDRLLGVSKTQFRERLNEIEANAERLYDLCKAKGWSIETLADRAGVSYALVYDGLRGIGGKGSYMNPEVENALNRALGIAPEMRFPMSMGELMSVEGFTMAQKAAMFDKIVDVINDGAP